MKKLLSLLMLISISLSNIFAQQTDERMQWFKEAKLGIFIHWGIYSVNGVAESWSFYNEYLPYEQYMEQTKGFTASKYNPEEWVRLIKESGAKYTVITSKHHDGVALWDTKANDLSVSKQTPAERDVLTPFVKEIRKQKGLKLGLYFSLLDWSHPDYPNKTRSEKRYKNDTVRWNNYRDFMNLQLKELSRTYKPDLFWFDGDWEQSAEKWGSAQIVERLHNDNKNVIINSRIQGYGDYGTPKQGVPVTRPKDKYWELCMTMNDSWGYQSTDTNYKTANQMLRIFVECLSRGGNMLMDISPKSDGTIPAEQIAILKEFGRWTSKHKEAIYQTRAGIPADHFKGYTTLNEKGDILYLYLPYKPTGPIEIKGLMNHVNRAWVIGNGAILNCKVHNKLYWTNIPGNLYIDVPENVLDEQITVIAVLLDSPVKLYRGEGQIMDNNF